MDAHDDWSTWWRYYSQEADFFRCTLALEDGDIIAVGPHEFQVIHTPGHASDGIVLYNRKAKILLSSDALWEKDVPVMTVRVEGSAALLHVLASLEKIAALDVKTVYPGHGRPFNDIKKALSKSNAKIETYLHNRELVGQDLLKKIIVYTLLMKKTIKENDFFPYLLETFWFKETVDLYFNGEYEMKYSEIMHTFFERGVVKRENGNLFTTVTP
jgi:glyoxylase-like metal-dependent hydrolase (beta-lactamase superfamily II)